MGRGEKGSNMERIWEEKEEKKRGLISLGVRHQDIQNSLIYVFPRPSRHMIPASTVCGFGVVAYDHIVNIHTTPHHTYTYTADT